MKRLLLEIPCPDDGEVSIVVEVGRRDVDSYVVARLSHTEDLFTLHKGDWERYTYTWEGVKLVKVVDEPIGVVT